MQGAKLTSKWLAICRLVRTDISSAGSVSGHPKWEDVIPQHSLDLMQWATALKVGFQKQYSSVSATVHDISGLTCHIAGTSLLLQCHPPTPAPEHGGLLEGDQREACRAAQQGNIVKVVRHCGWHRAMCWWCAGCTMWPLS